MKKIIFIVVLVWASFTTYSQEVVHWLINQDSIADCSFIKSGIFVNQIHECLYTKEYYIVIEDSMV